MFGVILVFSSDETEKNNFHCYARPFNLDDLHNLDDIIVKVSEKINYSESNYK